jgi:hypothetical protein
MFKANAGVMEDGGFAGFGWPTGKVKKANALVDRVRKRNGSAAIAMIENGRDLIELKGMCEHGEFEAAVSVKIGVSPRYARMQIAAYEWAEANKLMDVNRNGRTVLPNIDTMAIRLLASKKGAENTPRAIRLAEQGRNVTESLVKSWIAQGTPPRPASKKAENFISTLFDIDQAHNGYVALPRDQLIDEIVNLMNDGGISLDDLADRLMTSAREVA